MSIRKLFAMLIALSVLLAPSVAYASMPMPMPAAPQGDMQMMTMGHCDAPPAKSDGTAPVKNCCISMCMAVAVSPDVPAAMVELTHAATYFAVRSSWHGFLAEIATPPPRTA